MGGLRARGVRVNLRFFASMQPAGTVLAYALAFFACRLSVFVLYVTPACAMLLFVMWASACFAARPFK